MARVARPRFADYFFSMEEPWGESCVRKRDPIAEGGGAGGEGGEDGERVRERLREGGVVEEQAPGRVGDVAEGEPVGEDLVAVGERLEQGGAAGGDGAEDDVEDGAEGDVGLADRCYEAERDGEGGADEEGEEDEDVERCGVVLDPQGGEGYPNSVAAASGARRRPRSSLWPRRGPGSRAEADPTPRANVRRRRRRSGRLPR